MFAFVHAYKYLNRNSKLVCNQIPWADMYQSLVYISIIPFSSQEQKNSQGLRTGLSIFKAHWSCKMKTVSDNLPCLAGQIQIIDLLNILQDTGVFRE